MKAWRALGRFRAGEPLRPWLLAIVANEARNRRRGAGRRRAARRAAWRGVAAASGPAAPVPARAARDPPHRGPTLLVAAERRAGSAGRAGRAARRRSARARLPLPARLGEAETAAALGVRAGTVKSRTSRALGRLREALGEERDAELELELRALDPGWPATPDLATAVLARIESEAASGVTDVARPTDEQRAAPGEAPPGRGARLGAWRRPRRLALALLLLLGGAFAIPPARAAILDLLGHRRHAHRAARAGGHPAPVVPGAALGEGLGLGDAVTAAEARRRAGFTPGPPRALGRPDAIFFADSPPDGGRVSYLYRAGPGLPRAAETGAGLLVTVMLAQVSPFVEKLAGQGTRIERFRDRGDLVVRLSGAPHGVAYAGPGQEPIFEDQRLAGPTLLLERGDGLLVRVEGRVSRARALAVARSVSATP